MKTWLDDNEVLMYSTYNECKSIVAERFIRTFKAKIYKKNDSYNNRKSYLGYLNKLVDE